jgi:hypothetical protein
MKTILQTLLKSLLVGAAYCFALVIGSVIAQMVGLDAPEARDATTKLAWSFAGGVIAGLCLGRIAASMSASRPRHLMVWVTVIFLNLASVAIEGYFFAPEIVGSALPGLLFQQFLASFAAGWMTTVLFAPKGFTALIPFARRSILSWMWRFPLSALVYVFFYFIFGAVNYALVTRPYYETHAGGLTVPPVTVTLTTEILRGALIALSVLPFLLTARTNKKWLALQTGFILFTVGGLVPLTMQAGVLPAFLLAASAAEIFFQNFSTGVVISRLLSMEDGEEARQLASVQISGNANS